jgi:hypothetical protein
MCRFLDEMGLSRFWFYLSCFGRVQGLLPLAPAPSARLGHSRLDQVVCYRRYTQDEGLCPCAVFLMEWGLSVSGVCRGYCFWHMHPLPGWVIPDWIRSSVSAIYRDQRCVLQYIVTRDVARSGRRAGESMSRGLRRCCDGWGVQPLSAWILPDWGRSAVVASILGCLTVLTQP